MPTKRRALKHLPRIGEVRVTSQVLDLYRSFQEEVRAHGRYTRAAAELNSALQGALRHLPWEDTDMHDLHFTARLPRPRDPAEAPRRDLAQSASCRL